MAAASIAEPAFAEVAFRPLGFLPGESSSHAEGISANGTAIVGASGGAFQWTEAEGMVPLGGLPSVSPSSQAVAASQDGSNVVGYSSTSDGFPEAIRWTPQGIEELGFLPIAGLASSWADDVSDDGLVVVGRGWSEAVPGGVEAFRWTPASGMVGLGVRPALVRPAASAQRAPRGVSVA